MIGIQSAGTRPLAILWGLLCCWLVGVLVAVVPGGLAAAEPDDAQAGSKTGSDADGLFSLDRLVDVRITMKESDWAAMSGQTLSFLSAFSKTAPEKVYTYVPADITVNGETRARVGIRKKGFFGSMDQQRPSLKVKFNEYQKKQKGVRGLTRLTLNNNKQDRAHLSQILAYHIFRKAGLPAPRSGLAEVKVNGRSMGIYGHIESIKDPFLNRNFRSDHGELFEGTLFSDFLVGRTERFELKQTDRDDPRQDLRRLAELLAKPDDKVVGKLERFIDVDQFLTHWAVEALIGFWDGYSGNQNNYYMYRDPADKKYHFIPWGADFTMSASPFQRGPASVKAKGMLAFRLNQIPAVRKRYHQRMLKLLDEVWDEDELLAKTDRVERLVDGRLHAAQAAFKEALAATRSFIKGRRQQLLDETKDGPVQITTPPRPPMYFKEVGTLTAEFSTRWTATPNGDDAGAGGGDVDTVKLTVVQNGKAVPLEQLTVTAGPGRPSRFGRRGPQGPPPPTLTIVGKRAADKQDMTLSLRFRAAEFAATKDEPIRIQGSWSQGRGGAGFGPGTSTFMGTAKLQAAEQKAGAAVIGSVTGKLYQMQGGFGGGRRRPPPRRDRPAPSDGQR